MKMENQSNTALLEILWKLVPQLRTSEPQGWFFPFNLPIWPMKKTDGFWTMPVDYYKLNQR